MNPADWTAEGNAHFALGWPERALLCFERALLIDPDYAPAIHNRALGMAALGSFAEAVAAYERFLGLRPEAAAAWAHKGLALEKLGNRADAERSFARALELEPGLTVAAEGRTRVTGDATATGPMDAEWMTALQADFARARQHQAKPNQTLAVVSSPRPAGSRANLWNLVYVQPRPDLAPQPVQKGRKKKGKAGTVPVKAASGGGTVTSAAGEPAARRGTDPGARVAQGVAALAAIGFLWFLLGGFPRNRPSAETAERVAVPPVPVAEAPELAQAPSPEVVPPAAAVERSPMPGDAERSPAPPPAGRANTVGRPAVTARPGTATAEAPHRSTVPSVRSSEPARPDAQAESLAAAASEPPPAPAISPRQRYVNEAAAVLRGATGSTSSANVAAAQAAPLLLRALDPALGPPDAQWSTSLLTLAALHQRMGRDSLAATWLRWGVRQKPDLRVSQPRSLASALDAAKRFVQDHPATGGTGRVSWQWPSAAASDADVGVVALLAPTAGRSLNALVGRSLMRHGDRETLAPGTYRIQARAEGYAVLEFAVEVLPGVTSIVTLEPQRSELGAGLAVLDVTISPWAEVTVDGLPVGRYEGRFVDTLTASRAHALRFVFGSGAIVDTLITLQPSERRSLRIQRDDRQ